MIAHLGIDLALQQTGGDRSAARALIREGIIAQAEIEAKLANLSLKCRIEKHSGESGGCANDGTNCLCACHDRPATSPAIPTQQGEPTA